MAYTYNKLINGHQRDFTLSLKRRQIVEYFKQQQKINEIRTMETLALLNFIKVTKVDRIKILFLFLH